MWRGQLVSDLTFETFFANRPYLVTLERVMLTLAALRLLVSVGRSSKATKLARGHNSVLVATSMGIAEARMLTAKAKIAIRALVLCETGG